LNLLKPLAARDPGDIIAIISELRGRNMPNLIVRNVPEDVIRALKKRAGRHGTSAEAEHRKILTQALLKTRKRSFAEAIAGMPDVGMDSDFERVQDQNNSDVLD
jgi:antitoxin FitA